MTRKVASGAEPTQVDDPADAALARGRGEVVRRPAISYSKLPVDPIECTR
jgi:hypothetical protein